jgi:predicted TIM-barrel fold metal-dependent hydrolase
MECDSDYYDEGPEPFRPVGETEFVEHLTREFSESHASPAVVRGIVGSADLRSDEIEEVLEAHQAAGGGKFRGIRHRATFDPGGALPSGPARLLEDTRFRAGVAALGRASLSFDAWVYHPQLQEVAELARVQPGTTIILDHLGGPIGVGPYADRPDEAMAQWKAGMREVAESPNVFLKLSGVGMRLFGDDWSSRPQPPSSREVAEAFGDRIRWCIELFGAERCMFASNFPVDRGSFSYVILWNAFKRMVAGASAGEMAQLFHDSACRAYRLEP